MQAMCPDEAGRESQCGGSGAEVLLMGDDRRYWLLLDVCVWSMSASCDIMLGRLGG